MYHSWTTSGNAAQRVFASGTKASPQRIIKSGSPLVTPLQECKKEQGSLEEWPLRISLAKYQ